MAIIYKNKIDVTERDAYKDAHAEVKDLKIVSLFTITIGN
jgi:hypothetical protein